MEVLIIEDEIPARKKLKRFLEALKSKTEVVAEIDTVEGAIEFLSHSSVDVIFSDIELLDGNAFEIYDRVSVTCPIIFTTAYDQFLMRAFESNGIAYLLKPFSNERFQQAWEKFLLLRKSPSSDQEQLENLAKYIRQTTEQEAHKKRFAVHTNRGTYFLDTENVAYFQASESVIFAFDNLGKKHLLSEATLNDIEQQLSADQFFRINRGTLISKQHVEKIERYTKNTLAIKIKGTESPLKTSQSKTASFRLWIEQ